MTALTDPYAEAVVVACCIDNPRGAQLAHDRLDEADFHDPALGRLFTCSLALPADVPTEADTVELVRRALAAGGPLPLLLHERRAQAAADACQIRPAAIDELLAFAPVLCDETGVYARSVASAARRRRLAQALEAARSELDAGVDVDQLAPELIDLLGAA